MNKRDEYREVYLRSDHWRRMRRLALDAAEHRCMVCNARERLDVHHRTYRRLGDERVADLLVLCRTCHNLFHGKGALGGAKPKNVTQIKGWSQNWDITLRALRRVSTPREIRDSTNLSQGQVAGALGALQKRGFIERRGDTRSWDLTDKAFRHLRATGDKLSTAQHSKLMAAPEWPISPPQATSDSGETEEPSSVALGSSLED